MSNSDALPIPGYEHLTNADLQHRVRSLSEDGIKALIDHEQAHGNRTGVLQLLTERVEQLKQGAERSAGPADSAPPPLSGESRENATGPQTAGPPVHPPRHGVPGSPPQRQGREPSTS